MKPGMGLPRCYRQDVLFRRDGPDLIEDLLGKIGAGPHRLIFSAFHVHGCGALAVDIDPDATGLAFPAAFLASTFSLAFSFSLAFAFALSLSFTFAFTFPFHFSFAFTLSKGVGAHTERDAERGYAGGKCQGGAAGYAGFVRF